MSESESKVTMNFNGPVFSVVGEVKDDQIDNFDPGLTESAAEIQRLLQQLDQANYVAIARLKAHSRTPKISHSLSRTQSVNSEC